MGQKLTTLDTQSTRSKYKRIYRFELFVGARSEYLFNFIVSPQSYSITDKNRSAITKTLGGTHHDIFGVDNKDVQLSGNFGLNEASQGWDGKRFGSKAIGAFNAIKFFRDKFVRYPEWAKKKTKLGVYIKFYDFSEEIESDQNGWYVSIDNFTVSRDTSNVLGYKWAMKLTSLGRSVVKLEKKGSTDNITFSSAFISHRSSVADKFNAAVGAIKGIGSKLDKPDAPVIGGLTQNLYSFDLEPSVSNIFSVVAAVRGKLGQIQAALDSVNELIDEAAAFADIPAQYANQWITTFGQVTDLVEQTLSIPGNILDTVADKIDLYNEVIENLKTEVVDVITLFGIGDDVESSIAIQFKQSALRVYDSMVITKALVTSSWKGTTPFYDIVRSETERIDRNDDTVGQSENTLASRSTVNAKTVVQKQKQNFPIAMSATEIARSTIGDENVDLIAQFNADIDFADRQQTEVVIPTLLTRTEADELPFEFVFDENPNGKDIKLDKDDNIVVGSNGDAALTTDVFNTSSKFTRQLNTELGVLSSSNAYGLDPYVGEFNPIVAQGFIESQIIAIINDIPQLSPNSYVKSIDLLPDGMDIKTELLLNSGENITNATFVKGQ